MQRLSRLRRGQDGEDISDYDVRTGGVGNLTTYSGPRGIDLGMSKKLADYKKKYGPAFENKIREKNMELYGADFGSHIPFTSPYGDMLQTSQYKALAEAEAMEQYEQNVGMNRGLRSAHQKKNPMMFGG